MYATCFSALQRAENSSMFSEHVRFLKRQCFSALQRAENSSIADLSYYAFVERAFQCSSASRKFLNIDALLLEEDDTLSFSALQRAENSSI